MGKQEVTESYKGLGEVTRVYCGLQWRNKRLQKVTKVWRRLQGVKRVTGEYRRLHGFTRGYRRLQRITRR